MIGERPTFTSVDEAQRWILTSILDHGAGVRPRDMVTRELIGVAFSITEPLRRCISSPARKFSLPLAIGEFVWHMSGLDDVRPLVYYARRWADFCDDGGRITASCYGRKIFARPGEGASSQWEQLINVLRTDPDSRRAVLSLWDAHTLNPAAVDVACTCTIQFLVRDGSVHAVVFMRSNDAIWGVPYDIFLFTMLQEYLAETLGLRLGTYTHFAGSLHLYERHFALARRILSEELTTFEMPRMTHHEMIGDFAMAEERIRNAAVGEADLVFRELPPYWQGLAEVLSWFRNYREGAVSPPPEGPYRPLLVPRRSAVAAA